jgi:Coiled-coil domain-containing protein 124 /Oxs1
MESDGSGQGLRLNQKKERIKKEFEKSTENPFNQVSANYNATREDLETIKDRQRDDISVRLAERST